MTCLEFSGCENVVIVSGSRSITMDGSSILLFDSLPTQDPPEVQQ